MEDIRADSPPGRVWDTRRREKQRRIAAVAHLADGPVLRRDRMVEALESLVVSGDRVVLEGNNQKQADFLARALVQMHGGGMSAHSEGQDHGATFSVRLPLAPMPPSASTS